MAGNALQNSSKHEVEGRDYRFVALWAAGIIVLYTVTGYFTVRQLHSYRVQTARFRQDWLKASVAGQDANVSDFVLPAEAKPVDVHVGIYIYHIGEFSIKDNRWSADFDIWFRWTGGAVHPGENFEVVDGQIELREKRESYSKAGEQYERYHVRARIIKYFDASRFPFGDEGLAIQIEDGKDDARQLRYVADKQDIVIDPQAVRAFLKITQSGVWIKLHSYPAIRKVHSRFIHALLVLPPGIDFYVKMFQALFASMAVAFIVLFIKPIHVDPRFGLGVGAFFAVIGNSIYVQSFLPVSDRVSLADMVSGIGLTTIFITLVQSAVSLYVFDTQGKEELSSFFDKVSFVALLLGYVILNALLPLAARP
jgi:hypothetical protein